MDFSKLASVYGADNYKEAAIILPGPPMQVFGQRAAPTVVFRPLQQKSGCFYFECQTDTGGYMQLGWADADFKAIADAGKGVGDDAHSWAFDGHRVLKWHRNAKEAYGKAWKEGDTLGIAADLDKGNVSFFLNGQALGTAFSNINFSGALYPCVSLIRGQRLTFRFGLSNEDAFKFTPPTGYKGLTITDLPASEEPEESKYSCATQVISMNMSENSFTDSFAGEMMVKMMRRGLDYEAKKNGMLHAGYEATVKRYKENEQDLLAKTKEFGLNRDEILSLICYTLEKPPVYRFFNKDTREGFKSDGNDFPIINYFLSQGCMKILRGTKPSERTKVVYRGVPIPFSAEVGQNIRFGSYTSTSANPQRAEEFKKKSPGGTLFTITTKLGASIQMLSAFPEEEEFLLPPYEVFKVTKVEGTKQIFCESQTEDSYFESYFSEN